MIEEVHLRGLGVIDEATIPLGPGFTAITGETGAGKTMVVTGLGLLLGQRAQGNLVRAGSESAQLDGVWTVPQTGIIADRVKDAGGQLEAATDDTAELYLGRTINTEGRSRASVGGRSAPVGVLSELAEHLVVVHGQSEQIRLRSQTAQRDALDRFGGKPLAQAKEHYRSAYQRWQQLAAEYETLSARRTERQTEAEQLRHELSELEAVSPQPGEDQQLADRAEKLRNAEQLRAAAGNAREALQSENDSSDAAQQIISARRWLEQANSNDSTLVKLAEQLTDLSYRIGDIADGLSGYLADLDAHNPSELDAVEERRARLAGLVRRYGSLNEAITLWQTGEDRLAELEGDDQRIAELESLVATAHANWNSAAEDLTQQRELAANSLGTAISEELSALAMPDAVMTVAVSPTEPSVHGRDRVTLQLQAHTGASPQPVSTSASGGELSRVMLAIEVVLAATDPVPTFVFDEVDAGVGGAAAGEIGKRLARLAEQSQVIVVTHLPQIAAYARNHLSVVKSSDGTVTASSVRVLEGIDREQEIARLLSGLSDSESALAHARELLDRSAPRH